MIYLSGHSSKILEAVAKTLPIGLMVQPGNGRSARIGKYQHWGADNGCFAQGDKFDGAKYMGWLCKLPTKGCLFATAPDVLCDAKATWKRSVPYLQGIRGLGFPVALVGQNGIEDQEIQWDAFDCLFIGGDDHWKESCVQIDLVAEAKAQGKWVHMGRVNGERRFRFAYQIGCDSVDGNYLAFCPMDLLPKMQGWFYRLEHQQQMDLSTIKEAP